MIFERHTFQEEQVELDGNEFIDCTFIKTTLIFRGGTIPVMRGNQLIDPFVQFGGAATSTINFLSWLNFQTGGEEIVDKFIEAIKSGKPL